MADRQDDERARRLAAALRENLKRRKAQGRGREAGEPVTPGGEKGADSGPAVAGTTLSAEPDAP